VEIEKFRDMKVTAKGDRRASVGLVDLKTLWFNTGTQCNLECKNCYIESSPTNDRLSYLTADDVVVFLEEITQKGFRTEMIGFTGGEPFLNPHMISILEETLERGFEALVLTNANLIINRYKDQLIELNERYGGKLHLRVSLDHFSEEVHDAERGSGAFKRTIRNIKWLSDNGFDLSIASRSLIDETHEQAVEGHAQLLKELEVDLDLDSKMVVFPEMQSGRDVPEITTECWGILNKSPKDQMCATERMIVKRKGEHHPVVMPCTLLAYDDQFVMGKTLTESKAPVYLNHRFCAEFCVLGGASCSSTS
jgi:MoaA/NifB/PqqE/SkfB family radical SAM enzyme